MVDWCRAAGFEVVAAGKGTKYLPAYHESTPATVWPHYGFTPEMVAAGDFNAQMFNSFLDGTKSAIEMAAVANATGLVPAPDGLAFPPCGVDDLPRVLRPRDEGGQLAPRRAGRGDLVARARRPAGVPRPALGRLRDVPRRRRDRRGLRAALLQGVRLLDRPVGPLQRDVQAVPRDRAGARASASRPPACAASRPARRSRGTATSSPPPSARSPPARRSTARAASPSTASCCRRRDSLRAGRPAAGPRARREAHARRGRARAGALGRRRVRRRRRGGRGSGARWSRRSAADGSVARRSGGPAERRQHRAGGDEQAAERAVDPADVVRRPERGQHARGESRVARPSPRGR